MDRIYIKSTKLILHIGSPKTGTTSLQQSVFPHVNSDYIYLGKHINNQVNANDIVSKILNLVVNSNSFEHDFEIMKKQYKVVDAQGGRSLSYLLSDECLTTATYNGSRWITYKDKLLRLSRIIEWLGLEVDTIYLLQRQQAEGLHSLYVEGFDTYSKYHDCNTFEKFFTKFKDTIGPISVFDYKNMFDFIGSTFPETNLIPLEYDKFKEDNFKFVTDNFGYMIQLENLNITHANAKGKNGDYIFTKQKSASDNISIYLLNKYPSIHRIIMSHKDNYLFRKAKCFINSRLKIKKSKVKKITPLQTNMIEDYYDKL